MKSTEKLQGAAPVAEKGSITEQFEEACRQGAAKLRDSYVSRLQGDLEFFYESASVSDVRLLGEVIQTWQSFFTPAQENTLVGAMAELFE